VPKGQYGPGYDTSGVAEDVITFTRKGIGDAIDVKWNDLTPEEPPRHCEGLSRRDLGSARASCGEMIGLARRIAKIQEIPWLRNLQSH
jgi:hypothetical protein